jgi:hypothetical protein
MSNPFPSAAASLRQGIFIGDKRALMGEALPVVYREVQAETPERSGRLKRGTTYAILPNGSGVIRNAEAHALPVHEGSRPHIIAAKNAKTLAFSVGGVTVFPTRVRHPGNRPNAFMARGLGNAIPQISDVLGRWGGVVLAGMLKR